MPIRLHESRDFGLIRSILTHPKLYRHLTHDYAPEPEDFSPNEDPGIHYLIAYDQEILGVVTTHWIISPLLWQVHHAILPEHLARSNAIAEALESWLFTNTPCQTIIGFTPANNRLALKFAERHGMTRAGTIPGIYPKGGQLVDMVVFLKAKVV